MMLMKARLLVNGFQYNFHCNDRGRLTIPLNDPEEKIQLEYYDGQVRGRRCHQDRTRDLPWQTCQYEPNAVIELINQLNNADVATPVDGEEQNAQA